MNINNVDLDKQYIVKVELTRMNLKTFFLNLFGFKNPIIKARLDGKQYLKLVQDITDSINNNGGKIQ